MTETLKPQELTCFHQPKDMLRLTVADRYSVVRVEPRWAAPLSHPERFLSLMNAKGEEVAMVASLAELDADSRAAVEEELRRRYLTATVEKVLHAKVEFGATYWTVLTERGSRDFVVQSLQENAQWLGPDHLLLVDIDGNRFEIKDIKALDEKSRTFVDAIV